MGLLTSWYLVLDPDTYVTGSTTLLEDFVLEPPTENLFLHLKWYQTQSKVNQNPREPPAYLRKATAHRHHTLLQVSMPPSGLELGFLPRWDYFPISPSKDKSKCHLTVCFLIKS